MAWTVELDILTDPSQMHVKLDCFNSVCWDSAPAFLPTYNRFVAFEPFVSCYNGLMTFWGPPH